MIVTSNIDDFTSSRYVATGEIAIQRPGTFLETVLGDHPEVLVTALSHLASNRRGVTTIADVLDSLSRNHVLADFAEAARTQLL